MELVHVKFGLSGRTAILRVFIDKPGGVTLQDCQRISEQVSPQLDVEDPIPFSYVLEVSSPGLDRPLVKEKDFRRFVGHGVRIRTRIADPQGRRNFSGTLLDVKDGSVLVQDQGLTVHQIRLEDVDKANLEIEL
ncbi:MAG: ribosome maturation factor RimP [Acidobacteria bacterium]|nr:ribosome maturation factor RimP [Acidobacteriota bacterium]